MILVIAIIIAATTTTSLGVKTGCQIKTIGVSGLIICTFEKDISDAASKYGFIVQRSNLSHDDKRAEPVVDCSWLDKGLDCTCKPGYSFDNVVSYQAIIGIPNLTEEFEGKYVCQVIGNDDTDDKFCTLRFNDSLSRNSATTSPKPTTESRNTAVDGNDESGSSIPRWAIGMFVLFILSLVPVVAISVIIIRCWKRVSFRPTPKRTEESVSLTENQEPTLKSLEANLLSVEERLRKTEAILELPGERARRTMTFIDNLIEPEDGADSAFTSCGASALTLESSVKSSISNRAMTKHKTGHCKPPGPLSE